MEESSWDVYSGFICIAKECKEERSYYGNV